LICGEGLGFQLNGPPERRDRQGVVAKTQVAESHEAVPELPIGILVQIRLDFLNGLVKAALLEIGDGLLVVRNRRRDAQGHDRNEDGDHSHPAHFPRTPPVKPFHISTSDPVGMEMLATRSCLHISKISIVT
jgi:hypothetical protein